MLGNIVICVTLHRGRYAFAFLEDFYVITFPPDRAAVTPDGCIVLSAPGCIQCNYLAKLRT